MLLLAESTGELSPLLEHGRAAGWRLDTVATSTALLDRLARGGVGVVLLDSGLRRDNWAAVCRHLRGAFPALAVVLLLKHSRIYLRKQAFEAGIHDYIVLPIIPAEADARVRAALFAASAGEAATLTAPGGILLPGSPVGGNGSSETTTDGPADDPPEPVPGGAVRVLVAEDDRHIAMLLRHYLTCAGWEVCMAEDGEQAEQLITESDFQVIVLDNYMPYRSGFELLNWMRQGHRKGRSRVIMVSADGREDTVIRAFALGADDFIAKPFSPSLLVSRIQRFLGTPAGA